MLDPGSNRELPPIPARSSATLPSPSRSRIEIEASSLSQQLAILRREGFVTTRRQAQTIYYSLAPSNALQVIELLRDLYCRESRKER